MSNQPYGYDPFNPGPAGGNGYLLVQDGPGSGGCYYSGGQFGRLGGVIGVFPDGSAYKQSAEELRQYIMGLESTRRLQDLSNVRFLRNVEPADVLVYNHTTGFWELQNFICGGEW